MVSRLEEQESQINQDEEEEENAPFNEVYVWGGKRKGYQKYR